MPRETLTRQQILDAAITLLDDEGLEGLNMRALGTRLGAAATATYWHVGSKANLILLAGDHVWNEVPLPDPTTIGWRAAAEQMATGLYAMLTRHPWLVQAFGTYAIFGEGKARHDDHNLLIYETAGLSAARAEQAATTMFTFVIGSALGPSAARAMARQISRDGREAEETMRREMHQAREIASQFPRLRARLDSPMTEYAAGPDNALEFGLNAILDGIERQVPQPARRTKTVHTTT